jgi:hypothetical protein
MDICAHALGRGRQTTADKMHAILTAKTDDKGG